MSEASRQEAARKAAIEKHATYGSGPVQDVPLIIQLEQLSVALQVNLTKPRHRQSATVITDLRRKIRDVEKRIAAS